MTHKEFNIFLEERFKQIRNIMSSKSDDYSSNDNKLANFFLQARIDGITPIEALRGNQLKHRASICQGLDELHEGKIRPWKWWLEKCIDDINYDLLQLALLYETYFED